MFLMNGGQMVAALSFSGLMDAVGGAMKAADRNGGALTFPLRTAVARGENSLLMMPCLSDDTWGLKVLTVFPGNPGGPLPFLNGLVMLFNGRTGEPAALFDGRMLTALRTGAVGGAGVRALAKRDAGNLGIAGAGAQGYWQARFACEGRSFSEIRIFDVNREAAERLAERLRKDLPGIRAESCGSPEELAMASDVIITATRTERPVFPDERRLFAGGKCFVGIGSYTPDMREFPDALFLEARRVYADTAHALSETGDLITPVARGLIGEEEIRPLSEVLDVGIDAAGNEGTVFFKSVGLSVFDLFAAKTFLKWGKEKGIGVEFDL